MNLNYSAMGHWCADDGPHMCHGILGRVIFICSTVGEFEPHGVVSGVVSGLKSDGFSALSI